MSESSQSLEQTSDPTRAGGHLSSAPRTADDPKRFQDTRQQDDIELGPDDDAEDADEQQSVDESHKGSKE
jgi:hypothetical protein